MTSLDGQDVAAIRRIISKHFGVDEDAVQADAASFTEDLGADSLDRIELAFEFEEHFGIDLTDDDLEVVDTIGAAIKLIERKRGEVRAA